MVYGMRTEKVPLKKVWLDLLDFKPYGASPLDRCWLVDGRPTQIQLPPSPPSPFLFSPSLPLPEGWILYCLKFG